VDIHDIGKTSTVIEIRIRLRARHGKPLAILWVDRRIMSGDFMTEYLDRASTPIDEHVAREWEGLVGDIFARQLLDCFGVQQSIVDVPLD